VPHTMTRMDPVARRAQQRRRRIAGLAVAAVFAVAVVVAIVDRTDWVTDAFSGDKLNGLLSTVWDGWLDAIANPWYWGLIAVLLVVERIWPAEPAGGMVSMGGAHDIVWILGAPILRLTLVAAWASLLNLAYDDWFSGAEVDLAAVIGTFPTAVVAFVLSDFLMWFTHWVRHKVPTFWYFHAVHHAAPTLNALSDNRVHFVEAIIHATIVVLPSRWLGLDAPAATALAIATTYFTAFTHTAVRTNMGPLRWILVTPQSHRVHHSFATEHLDTNFATVFSFWDIIFRTQYMGWDEYPATGIADPDFPLEKSASPGALLSAYARQNVYPFQQVARDVGKFRRARASAG
jgi:sterol desaturase/sphingolipid hydroxylase (fatty acid hydroxylase superfamily)